MGLYWDFLFVKVGFLGGVYFLGGGLGGLLIGVLGRRDEEIGKYKDKYDELFNLFEVFKGWEV